MVSTQKLIEEKERLLQDAMELLRKEEAKNKLLQMQLDNFLNFAKEHVAETYIKTGKDFTDLMMKLYSKEMNQWLVDWGIKQGLPDSIITMLQKYRRETYG